MANEDKPVLRPRQEEHPPTGRPSPVFGPDFYRHVLPSRVVQECQKMGDAVPVVLLHLANGTTLDLCHIPFLAESWMAAHYYRDADSGDEMDLAFVPYTLVSMVTMTTRHRNTRRLGFDLHEHAGERHPLEDPAVLGLALEGGAPKARG